MQTAQKTIEELTQIKDIGERILYLKNWKDNFEQSPQEQKEQYRLEAERLARQLMQETDILLTEIQKAKQKN